MEIVRAEALVTRSSADDGVAATWLAGPGQGETLDVAIVHFTAGAATPPHVHHGGQTLVAVAGTGYVEAGGERAILHPERRTSTERSLRPSSSTCPSRRVVMRCSTGPPAIPGAKPRAREPMRDARDRSERARETALAPHGRIGMARVRSVPGAVRGARDRRPWSAVLWP
jgi:hypothetical protein